MIPKKLKKGNKEYNLVKIYPNFVLYENEETKIRECFTKYELGLVQPTQKTREANRGGICKR